MTEVQQPQVQKFDPNTAQNLVEVGKSAFEARAVADGLFAPGRLRNSTSLQTNYESSCTNDDNEDLRSKPLNTHRYMLNMTISELR